MSKETQNKWEEEEYEKEIDQLYRDYILEFARSGKIETIEIARFIYKKIKQKENEAYQRGKSETLEEVERVIKDMYILRIVPYTTNEEEAYHDRWINEVSLLQTINNMKTKV